MDKAGSLGILIYKVEICETVVRSEFENRQAYKPLPKCLTGAQEFLLRLPVFLPMTLTIQRRDELITPNIKKN